MGKNLSEGLLPNRVEVYFPPEDEHRQIQKQAQAINLLIDEIRVLKANLNVAYDRIKTLEQRT